MGTLQGQNAILGSDLQQGEFNAILRLDGVFASLNYTKRPMERTVMI